MASKTQLESLGASIRRPLLVGFLVGFFATVPVTFLALIFGWAERLSEWLLPGAFVLRPLLGYMATWSGAVNMGLTAVVNGLVYGAVTTAVVVLLWLGQHRPQGGGARRRRL